jgi:hypothetical protein
MAMKSHAVLSGRQEMGFTGDFSTAMMIQATVRGKHISLY